MVGDVEEVFVKDGVNGVITGYSVQGILAVDDVIWEWELGGDGGHVQIARGIPALGSKKYYGDEGVAYDKRGVGVASGGWSAGDF